MMCQVGTDRRVLVSRSARISVLAMPDDCAMMIRLASRVYEKSLQFKQQT
jgi:hypothetical protein